MDKINKIIEVILSEAQDQADQILQKQIRILLRKDRKLKQN